MAITVMERADSMPLTNDPRAMSVSREYWALSTNSEENVLNINDAVANASPNLFLGMIKKRIDSKPLGGGLWHISVEYGAIEGIAMQGQGGAEQPIAPPEIQPAELLKADFGFTTSGGTEHIARSLDTVGSYAYGGRVAPQTNNAIGVSKNGVAGCDVIAPKLEISITRRLAWITMNYVNQLVDCTGCVNSVLWNCLDHHTALFLGAEGHYNGQQGDDWWLVTYKFLIGKNRQNVTIRPSTNPATPNLGLIVAQKFAHDYLWVGYENDVDATAGVLLQVPWFAKVERVYEERNFRNVLGF